jgi:hypothetical protein
MYVQTLLKVIANFLFAPRYHPERHYMRGPGPKSRAAAGLS